MADLATTIKDRLDAEFGAALPDERLKAARAIGNGAMPAGVVLPFAGAVAPAGFLLCDGRAVSRTMYAALFAAIGITYGAPDGSTFNVPDMRGRAPIGAGQGGGLTNRALNATGGAETHALTESEMPSHRHPYHFTGYSTGYGDSRYGGDVVDQSGTKYTDYVGGGAAHNNMQPFRALNFIIAT